eukprot:CAMPEP_0179012310 /NCGR_PEP_ID=MMETSP0796-20121207/1130_1 /TAXON_ID=73915 /ORGANISM="Pyrodinium bahamense, Strain pbaha01" /LENGTH=67 /DNA_ID=CAMNT_0020707749 /DNA_START=114 /DNA_END=314 /DNA_ORIENTATION=+
MARTNLSRLGGALQPGGPLRAGAPAPHLAVLVGPVRRLQNLQATVTTLTRGLRQRGPTGIQARCAAE